MLDHLNRSGLAMLAEEPVFPRIGPTRQLNAAVWALATKPADQMTAADWQFLEQIEREGAEAA